MNIIKFLILTVIFFTSLYIGFVIARKYTDRVRELKNMKNALNMFETKIRFTYETIPSIFLEISKQIGGQTGKVFETASLKMKEMSAGEAWNRSVDEIANIMNEEDRNVLKNLGKLLGKTDIEGQISEIQLVSVFLNTQIKLAEEDKKKNEKMYRTLGGIIGLVIVIILF